MNVFLEKICLRIIRICSFLILCIPLVVVKSTLYPYLFPKVIFFQIITEIAFIAWVPLFFLDKKYRPRFTHPLIAFLSVFIAVLVCTALTGVDSYRSFFSTQERMTGVFAILHFYIWFLMLVSTMRSYKDWRKLIICTIGVSIGVALLTPVQDASARSISTVGNAIFFASYILLHVFLLIFFIQRESWNKRRGVLFFCIFALYSFAIFFSGSRMIMASFVFGVSAVCVLFFAWYFSRFPKIICGIGICILLVGGGVAYINTSSFGIAWAKKQLPYSLQRVFLLEKYQTLRAARLEAWRMGLDGFKERPLLGWGSENYVYIFQKFYSAPIVDEGESYADKSHNQYVDLLALTGIIGFLAYMSFFVVLFVFLARTIATEKELSMKLAGASLAVLFFTYLLQNTTSFDTPALLITIYFCFALAYFFVSKKDQGDAQSREKDIQKKFPKIFFVVEALTISFVIFSIQKWNILPFIKNMQTRVAFNVAKEQGLNQEILSSFKDSLNSESFTNYETRTVFAKSVYNLYMEKRATSKDFAKQTVLYAIAELDKSIDGRPQDAKNYFSELLLYRTVAPYDQDTLKKIERRMQEVYKLAPNRPEIYREFPEMYIAMQDFSQAEEWVRKGADHFIPPQETHWQLAVVFLQKGDVEGGLSELAEAETLGYPIFENVNMAVLLSQKLPDGKKNPAALHYIDRMVATHPENSVVLAAYKNIHKKAE